MFTTAHFIWLGACAVLIVLGVVLALKFKLPLRIASYVIFGTCVASELAKTAANIIPSPSGDGYILDPLALPFHVCSLFIFLIAYITFAKNESLKSKLLSFFVPIAIGGGVMAMLIPTNGVDFCDIEAYQCFVYHAGIVWFALYLIFTKQADLGVKSYIRNILILGSLALGSIYVNSILSVYGTNFLYTSKPPMENLPILNLDNGWFVYILSLAAVGLLLLTVIHLPFMLKKNK